MSQTVTHNQLCPHVRLVVGAVCHFVWSSASFSTADQSLDARPTRVTYTVCEAASVL